MPQHVRKRPFLHFGFTTLLLGLVMLGIVTFCALALLTARADLSLSRKMAENNTHYYEAEQTAYETLAALDAMLETAYREAAPTYRATAVTVIQSYAKTHPALHLTADASGNIRYEVPIQDHTTLAVALHICLPQETDGHFYELQSWQCQNRNNNQENSSWTFRKS